ncbi:Nramp family divalent metal transporter [Desmospora activa]|uniref:NRAMP (Natural resistance-associated macrophage protein)-like metal ion transporter n=1 Tax=Desmospora activa DSM 45169 TaxID=1121389 RepID=A0A2T4ZCI8_9BACL|nr:Nramp family divalent metal transporter [Desmospora activa]PTM59603.1 NRAMP (natural resistance-associated macrophage protein)-like metal ion transporter [Desmospora activa DSM 45169]
MTSKEDRITPSSTLTFKDYVKAIGPGVIIAAAIIGPGTVTTTSVAGATYGYEALWIVILACVVSYFYQEPAIRITLRKSTSLMEGVRQHVGKPASGFLLVALITGAVAFQAGNFTGAAMALNYFIPEITITAWALTMAISALVIAWLGVYTLLENINKVLIGLMVVAFVITGFVSGPSLGDLVSKGFSFRIPGGDYWMVLALLATTLPPNTVLGLSAFLKKKYATVADRIPSREIALSRFDLRFNMVITAFITGSIIICAGAVIHPQGIEITGAEDMAMQLTPLLGRFAGVSFALGLWAAGFSSGLYQASLAYILMNQAFGWPEDATALRSRIIMVVTSLVPVGIIALFDEMPIAVIVTAQALNGLALPLVAALIWLLSNKKDFLGDSVNNSRQNIIYGLIMLLVTFLALRVFLELFHVI